jgi:hypothetical protein
MWVCAVLVVPQDHKDRKTQDARAAALESSAFNDPMSTDR